MPFNAVALRVLIASPSDTADSRRALVDAINEWNDLNSESLGVVLIPALWEISASPEMGDRPQAIINRQVVDRSDILIGTFWTRLGTPTGIDVSGTAEEISRMINRRAQVLIYFSNQPATPATLDPDQLRALMEYKGELQANGLCSEYETVGELAHRVQRDLRRTVERLTQEGSLAPISTSAMNRGNGNPPDLDESIRAELRRLAAVTDATLRPLIEGHDVDAVRRLMGNVAHHLTGLVGDIAAEDPEAPASERFQKLAALAETAGRLERFDVFLDGGKSWSELAVSAEQVVAGARTLANGDSEAGMK